MKAKRRLPAWTGWISFPLYFLLLICIDLVFRWLYGFVGRTELFSYLPILFTVGWATVMTATAVLLPRTFSRIYMILTVVLFGVLTLAHAALWNLFGTFFSLTDLNYAGDGIAFFSLSYIKIRKLLIVFVIFAVIGAVFAAVCLPKRGYSLPRVLTGAALFVCGGLCVWLLHSSMTVKANPQMIWWGTAIEQQTMEQQMTETDQKIYTEFDRSNLCLPMTGIYQYSFRDLTKWISIKKEKTDHAQVISELQSYYSQREISGENKMTGALAGKNVLMIMVESLDSWMVTPEYAPNLYALQQKSVNFTNHYTPLYLKAGTFGTEFISQTGIIPPNSVATTDVYVDNTFSESLPKLFAAQGYSVNSFHSANPLNYNRGSIHKNLGFSAYHSYADMGMSDYMLDSQMINAFDQMTADAPFFSFIITYSGHGPYDGSLASISQPNLQAARQAVAASGVTASEETMEEYTIAVAHIMETDQFFGELIDRLEETGLLENTVLIVYGDHYCKYLTNTEFLMQLKGVSERNLLCNTPLFIYSEQLKPQTVEKYTSSVDIYPTICNLFALDTDLTQFVGDDAFGSQGGYVYWPDYSWYDGTIYHDGADGTAQSEYETAISAQVRDKLSASWNTLNYDYFAVKGEKNSS